MTLDGFLEEFRHYVSEFKTARGREPETVEEFEEYLMNRKNRVERPRNAKSLNFLFSGNCLAWLRRMGRVGAPEIGRLPATWLAVVVVAGLLISTAAQFQGGGPRFHRGRQQFHGGRQQFHGRQQRFHQEPPPEEQQGLDFDP